MEASSYVIETIHRLSWSLVVEIEGRWPWQGKDETSSRPANP
jgi:hypothetical protein